MNNPSPPLKRQMLPGTDKNPQQQTILVVDDSPDVIALVDETLRPAYRIRIATGGLQALALLEKYPEVDLILLDVLMPDMDGFETCRRIKEIPALCGIPLIFLTALNENADEAYGLGLGAVDYIAKPVAPLILRARVGTHLELCRIRKELQEKNDILNAEREVIEGMIVRMRADPDFDNRHLRWLMQPVERTSGDICLAAFCPDGRQMVLVGDFTGHGLTAAIAGPGVKQAFYSQCASDATLAHLANTLNHLLYEQMLVSQFMTAHLVEISPTRRQAKVWGGGMPEPLHADAHGKVRRINACGLPLGVIPVRNVDEEAYTLSLQAGEHLLLFTDGITETANDTGEMYGIARLEAGYTALLQSGGPLAALIDELNTFATGGPQVDDRLLLELNV